MQMLLFGILGCLVAQYHGQGSVPPGRGRAGTAQQRLVLEELAIQMPTFFIMHALVCFVVFWRVQNLQLLI